MNIELKEIAIRELIDGFEDKGEEGVVGFGGKLDIRPPYQREFIYNDKQKQAVINSVINYFPLNAMYWAVRNDGTFEIIDGQQRTMSICQYVNGDFSYNKLYFHNLPNDKQELILNYKLMVYLCDGTDSEKLEWFKTINIAGEELTEQELRNAVYAGPWVSDAKRYFSKRNCPAYRIGNKYLRGDCIRQKYLETVIKWICHAEGIDKIEDYMGKHQFDLNANELWLYFQNVVAWVETTFKVYRREMQAVQWGELYNIYGKEKFDTNELEKEIAKLMEDEDVTKKSGIYYYIFTRDEKYLNIRVFSDRQKREAYERQNGICPVCGKEFDIDDMEADHIIPWSEGGQTTADNCQMLCKLCNRRKSNK